MSQSGSGCATARHAGSRAARRSPPMRSGTRKTSRFTVRRGLERHDRLPPFLPGLRVVPVRNLGWRDRDRFRRVRSGAYRPGADLRAVGGPQGEVAQCSVSNRGVSGTPNGEGVATDSSGRAIKQTCGYGSRSSHWRKRFLRIGIAAAQSNQTL